MRLLRSVVRLVPAIAALLLLAVPASATTLIREGLESLTRSNGLVVHGKVAEIRSYWNEDHSFIFTDVRVTPIERVKDLFRGSEDVTFTVLGGTVGDVTTLVIGGPELVPGSEYVLFLAEDTVLGRTLLTAPSLSQGIFEVFRTTTGVRAVSQAAFDPLLPDANGLDRAPGGAEGLDLDTMLMSVRRMSSGR